METVTQLRPKKIEIVIGIDPGVETGFAVFHRLKNNLIICTSVPIHTAMEMVKRQAEETLGNLIVRIEDARQRKWFGKNAGFHALQGAGSIKRDCRIWNDYLWELKIAAQFVPPGRGSTKWSAETFRKRTGWDKQTNEHARDAGVLCWQY